MARKNVTFDLGYVPSAAALASRHLIVTRMRLAGVDTAPAASYDNAAIGGTTDSITIPLKDNFIYQAVLIDTKTSGEVSVPQIINFQTGSLQFPGPRAQEGSFRIYAMEDLSSSSDSSINSSSSSSSSNSSSASSNSSSSRSSASSASSINSSSSSASSINSSSSSSSSINSSSSSSSLSSSSSSSGSSSSNSSSSSS